MWNGKEHELAEIIRKLCEAKIVLAHGYTCREDGVRVTHGSCRSRPA